MRRMLVVGALLTATAACGSSAPAGSPIVFGVTGGNVRPFDVTIGPSGDVRASGPAQPRQEQLGSAALRRLQRQARPDGLSSRDCPGTLPDVASRFIRTGGRTVRVHGSCEPRFQRLWNALAQAVGLGSG